MNIEMIDLFLTRMHLKKKIKDNQVVFIAEFIKPRMAKMGYALKKHKYEVIIFLAKKNANELVKMDSDCYDKVILFNGKKDLLRKCLLYSPICYHILSEAYVCDWTQYLISQKNMLGKMVYDQYDIYRGFITDRLDDNAQKEKYCLENADGLCCRMFETQYLKHQYDYKFGGKRLLFLDYCWDRYFKDTVSDNKSEKLKFVYGGRLYARPYENFDRYQIELNGFKYISETIKKSKDSFVIIPSSECKGNRYSAYRMLAKKYKNVSIKDPMPFYDLIQYERQMDYGIDCVELEEDIETFSKKINSFNIKAKNKYYATNKYFDYLDAGVVPIYGRQGELFGNYLDHMGGAVKCRLEELPNKIEELRLNCQNNKRKVSDARKKMSIENQIERLIDFYHMI